MLYPRTPEELVIAIREQRAKCQILHKARCSAWDSAREADVQREFLVDACRSAEAECADLQVRLERALRDQAVRMVAS